MAFACCQNVVPNDVPQDFGLVIAFCESSFGYLSSGSKEEKCRFLDFIWQTLFIHSSQLMTCLAISIYIFMEVHQLFTLHVVDKSELWHGVCSTIAQAILPKPLVMVESGYSSSFVFQYMIHTGAYCHKIHAGHPRIHICCNPAISNLVPSYWFLIMESTNHLWFFPWKKDSEKKF